MKYDSCRSRDKDLLIAAIRTSPNNEIELWAQCFCQYDPLNKILRNLSPTQVVIVLEPSTSRWASPGETIMIAYEVTSYRRGKGKVIKLETNNNHGDTILYDTFEECAQEYNKTLQKHIEISKNALAAHIKTINRYISTMENSMIPGQISE